MRTPRGHETGYSDRILGSAEASATDPYRSVLKASYSERQPSGKRMSTAPTLDECSAFLQRPNAAANGSTVFGHVSEILLKLVEERPINPVDVFEEVCA